MQFFITTNGIDVVVKDNINDAVKVAEEKKCQVFIWNKDHTGVELVYSYGEARVLANLK